MLNPKWNDLSQKVLRQQNTSGKDTHLNHEEDKIVADIGHLISYHSNEGSDQDKEDEKNDHCQGELVVDTRFLGDDIGVKVPRDNILFIVRRSMGIGGERRKQVNVAHLRVADTV